MIATEQASVDCVAGRRPGRVSQGRRTPGRLAPWQINRVLAYVEANPPNSIQARDLALAINLSTSHFFRGFRVSTGLTPFEYVAQRRVELALKLISTTR